MLVSKTIFLLGVVAFMFYIYGPSVKADLVNPEYRTKTCQPGEKEVEARYESEEAFGPRTYDETQKYENNPDYYRLVERGSSYGGKVKYCQKTGAATNADDVILLSVLFAAVPLGAIAVLYIIRSKLAPKR